MADAAKKPVILAVDDEPWNLEVLKGHLEPQGYTLVTASNGSEALDAVNKQSFDLVLLDVMMPVMDGFEVCKKIKADKATKALPIILVTALSQTEDKVRGLDAGADDFLSKPINAAELSARVRAHLRIKSLTDQLQSWNDVLEEKVIERTEIIRQRNRMVAFAYHTVLESLVTSLDIREHDTGKHSLRVAYYATELAKRIGIPEEELNDVAMGALLHDIGKIGVPDAVLLKPSKLTDEEFAEIKKHPQTGYDLIRDVDFIGYGRELVLSHHERFDGKGYPRGIAGKDIYLGARVFVIIETMDVMTSKRPYKDAWPFSRAFDEIRNNAGAQFDPDVVDVFFEFSEDFWKQVREEAERSTYREFVQRISHALDEPTLDFMEEQ